MFLSYGVAKFLRCLGYCTPRTAILVQFISSVLPLSSCHSFEERIACTLDHQIENNEFQPFKVIMSKQLEPDSIWAIGETQY